MNSYKPTIGLEIHAQLKTKTKMFCDSLNDPTEQHPNVNVCSICMGHPGTLPTINKKAVEAVIKTGLALHTRIASFSKFDRKNYFYPDIPKGYQISQYDLPLCAEGFLDIGSKKIRIRRIHLEEDTGRLLHNSGESTTFVDFNRAGVPLMELVTEPDIVSGNEASKFAQELQLIFRYLGVSDADMEKGQMRVEVNISMNMGTKVELKNINSFRAVERAIDYEIERQSELLEKGEKVKQETRGWNDSRQCTVSQRSKEEAHDYRYFPEPDLPPLTFVPEEIEEMRALLPELPQNRRERFVKEYGLPNQDVEVLVMNKDLGEYYEQTVSEFLEWMKEEGMHEGEKALQKIYKLAANYVITDLQSMLLVKETPFEELKISPENFAEYIKMLYKGEITSRVAKDILEEMFLNGDDPTHIVDRKGLKQVNNEDEIEEIARQIIKDNEKAVLDYKSGKIEVLKYMVGKIMGQTNGKVNPQVAESVLKKLLG